MPGAVDDQRRGDGGGEVAKAGDEAEDAVPAEAEAEEGHPELRIEAVGEAVEAGEFLFRGAGDGGHGVLSVRVPGPTREGAGRSAGGCGRNRAGNGTLGRIFRGMA